MSASLPIGIDELLGGAVESTRLEFKSRWDPDTTGFQVLKTLCAFANDLQNLNGGYIVIGVAENNGVAVRPVRGLDDAGVEAAQKWIRGNCNRIDPVYAPVMDVCEIDGLKLLVLWAPASDIRPHQAPDGSKGAPRYWIRLGSETVIAKDSLLTTLMQLTAKVPFDDRRAQETTVNDLSFALAGEFLHDVRSDLQYESDADRVYRAMQIVAAVNGHSVPKNIALLFFSRDPERWFRGARIEVVEFYDDAGGNTLSEHVFRGPLHHQVRQCLAHLESMTTRHLEKSGSGIETRGWLSFPVPALREAVVNAVYHRSYEHSVEPTKVYLYPNRIEIVSYPGPVPGIEPKHLDGSAPVPPVPARNRRIGEFFKELRLAEGRGTGIPKIRRSMNDNGSPSATFDFDPERTYFRVTLPAHPEYVAVRLLSDYAYRKATGDDAAATAILQRSWNSGVRSPSIGAALVSEYTSTGDWRAAETLVNGIAQAEGSTYASVITALATAYADAGDDAHSKSLLDGLPNSVHARDALDAAVLERRLGRQDRAHSLFGRAGALVLQDARALHEFAQTKLMLAGKLARSRRPAEQQTRRRLLQESMALLDRVIQMDGPPIRHAWAWYNLGQVRKRLGYPRQEVVEAYRRAQELAPGEPRFQRALDVPDRGETR